MDQSITRRGQPCWYRVQDVGNIAVNDAFMLEGAIYHLLKKHFREEPYYVHLLELFHEVRFRCLNQEMRLTRDVSDIVSDGDGSAGRFDHRPGGSGRFE